ncbi:hypothetical protein [Streptomyces sp. DSM 40750]|uniref:hypothetical protein n=1 Tax=Streptomyces sp. DSM 40750 TaxID=2801030 RepID=UPI00214C07AC|nr:hypothetical protein [Streptomyces sp. DSM 40750]UUU28345.1 hypothetical protein JIX55_45300 [Streptomyces sp. DSM 40750]
MEPLEAPTHPPHPTLEPSPGYAEVRVVAASPEVARRVAEVLRRCFASDEQRSYPAGRGGGTRLHLTVDTTRPAEPARSWLVASQSSESDHEQTDEIRDPRSAL